MRDITHKPDSRREAVARATLALPAMWVEALRERRLEKGDALEIARVAGIQAIKKTWDLIPFCHQIPITGAAVRYEFGPTGLDVLVSASTVAPTGVEMEAMTGASIAAMTLYDMLKPHTSDVVITRIELLSKTGGKSDMAWPGDTLPLRVVHTTDATRAERWTRDLATPQPLIHPLGALTADGLRAWVTAGPRPTMAVLLLAPQVAGQGLEGAFDVWWPGIAQQLRHHAARRVPGAAGWLVLAGTVNGVPTLLVDDHGSVTDEAIAAAMPAFLAATHALLGSTHTDQG